MIAPGGMQPFGPMSTTTFRQAYRLRHGCPDDPLERELLMRCRTPWHSTLAKFVMGRSPDFWAFELRRPMQAGKLTKVEHLYDIASDFADPRRDADDVRTLFGARPSGRSLIAIAAEVLEGGTGTTAFASRKGDAPINGWTSSGRGTMTGRDRLPGGSLLLGLVHAVAGLAVHGRLPRFERSRLAVGQRAAGSGESRRLLLPAGQVAPRRRIQGQGTRELGKELDVGGRTLAFADAGGGRFLALEALFHDLFDRVLRFRAVAGATGDDEGPGGNRGDEEEMSAFLHLEMG